MKKLLISIFLLSGLFVGSKTIVANAEEDVSDVSEEISISESEISEEISSSEIVSSSEVTSDGNVILDNKDKIEDKLNEWFSPQTVANIMSWVAYLGTIVGLVNSLKKAKRDNNLTLDKVKEQVCGELEKVVNKEVTDKVAKYFDSASKLQNETKDILEIFAKIMALSQENTPESRLAILDLIKRLGANTGEMTEEIKKVIELQEKTKEEKKKSDNEKLETIIEDKYDGTSV